MIKVDENDPVGEVEPSFPYREVNIRRNVDMKEFYDLESEIGRGKFGTVYRCREKSTGLALAAKFVGIAKRQERRNVEKEVEIMRTLQHPRLIQLYDSLEFGNVMCVILELIEGGELFERVIDDDFVLTEKACSVFMRQICEGVAFIHSKNILHLDLKPENIMCLTRTGNRIKIIDFGLARQFDPEKKLQILFGTPEFVAPEVVNFDAIGYGTDMWSVGVICYVLLSGLSPFMGETDVETMANVTIAQYDFDDVAFDEISEDAKDFVRSLLMKDKERRMSANDCLSHKWLRRKPLVRPADLGTTKDKLKSVVERWSNQPPSPTKIVIESPTEPNLPSVPENVSLKIEESGHSKTDVGLIQPELSVESIKPVTNDVDKSLPSIDKVSTSLCNVSTNVDKVPTDEDKKSTIDTKLEVTTEQLPKKTQSLIIKPVEDKDKTQIKITPKGNKNVGDLDSPSPSKQPKVELKPVKSKGLTHNQTLPNIAPTNEPKITLANNVKGKNAFIANKVKDKVAEDETNKFNLKPSSSVPNFLNPRIQPPKTELNYSKILTQNVKPKIAGIVLGQSIPVKSELSNAIKTQEKPSNLAKENIPKIITHKIIIEGKTDQTNKGITNLPPNSKETEQTKFIPAPFSDLTSKSIPIPCSNVKSKNNHETIQPKNLDKIERRSSDFSCFLHDSESPNTAHFHDEIKSLSAKFFQMSPQHKSLDEDNNNTDHPRNVFNDPIRQFLANHGVITRRTKHRMTNLNRDVPIGSPPPPSNFSYLVSHCPPSSSRLPWVKHFSPEIHSAPQSPRISPCRFPEGTSREAIKLFDKLDDTSTSASSSSSIDSLVNYFKTASEAQKRATPAK